MCHCCGVGGSVCMSMSVDLLPLLVTILVIFVTVEEIMLGMAIMMEWDSKVVVMMCYGSALTITY